MTGYVVKTEHDGEAMQYRVVRDARDGLPYWYVKGNTKDVAIVGLLPPELTNWNPEIFASLQRLIELPALLGSQVQSIEAFVGREMWTARSPREEMYLPQGPLVTFKHSAPVVSYESDFSPSGEHLAVRRVA